MINTPPVGSLTALRIIILFAATSCLSSASAGAPDHNGCAIALVTGVEVQPPYPFDIPAGSKVFQLGKGIMGGTVYRVILPDSKPIVLKVYYSYSFKGEEIVPSLRVDLAQMKALEEAIQGENPQSEVRFRVAKTSQFSNNTMKIEDISGTNLEQVLDDINVAESLRQHLLQKYNTSLAHLVSRLRLSHENIWVRPDGLIRLDNSGSVFSKFLVKADNVIVTRNLELVIVDPY